MMKRCSTAGLIPLSLMLFQVACSTPQPNLNANGNFGGDANSNGNDNGNGGTAGMRLARVAAIGDYGDDDDNSRAVADLIKGWAPDAIITVGDNDYSDGAFRGTFEGLERGVGQYFHTYIGDYQGTSGAGAATNRFFPVPGDHDWGDTCADPRGLDDYLAYFTLPSGASGNERYYDFRQGPVHFFALHSLEDCEPDGATADSAQARWVADRSAASNAAFKVAYFHNPPYSSGANHIGDGAHMRWPWAAMGFDLVLSGDDHIYERIEHEGVVYLVTGNGGVDLHPLVATPVAGSVVRANQDYGAVRIDVYAGHLEVAAEAVGGRVLDHFTIGEPGGRTDAWYRPPVDTTWQWQLQPDAAGSINTSYDVDLYDLDLFDVEQRTIDDLQAAGRRVLCYFSAGTYEDFRDDRDEFLASDLGTVLDDFADERWIDIRSANVRRIMLARLDLAAERGCDGVEPDNVTGFQNDSGFDLTAADQLDFNRFLAAAAHARGMAVALKNDLDQIVELVDDFDLAVNEQCHEFDECDRMQPFIDAGKPVLNAEYRDDFVTNAASRAAVCVAAQAQGVQTLVLPLDLDDAFRFSCQP